MSNFRNKKDIFSVLKLVFSSIQAVRYTRHLSWLDSRSFGSLPNHTLFSLAARINVVVFAQALSPRSCFVFASELCAIENIENGRPGFRDGRALRQV